MSIPKFLFWFCITLTTVLTAFTFGNLLYCQHCPNTRPLNDMDEGQYYDCSRCASVDQFHKTIFPVVPGLGTVAKLLHLEVLADFAELFHVLKPVTIEIISVMAVFLLVSIILSAM